MSARIAISTSSFGEFDSTSIELCRNKGFEVILNPYKRTVQPNELVAFAKDAVGLIAGTESLNKEVLSKMQNLRVISRCGAGVDNIDKAAADNMGIKIFNTPDAPTTAVAELTVGLILNLIRKISLMDSDIRQGNWQKRMGALLSGKRIGIIGFGRIGRKVAELLAAFKCEIAYTDPSINDESTKKLPFAELLTWADIVSIHVSSNDRIFGEKEIQSMKKGAWLVNVSRGSVVDEEALYQALINNHLSGTAIDVFAKEPYNGPLKELDNVVLTPHIGSYAKEARIKMEIEAAENLIKGLNNG